MLTHISVILRKCTKLCRWIIEEEKNLCYLTNLLDESKANILNPCWLVQGCESICEKKSEIIWNAWKDVLLNALKVWKWGFMKSTKSLKSDLNLNSHIPVSGWRVYVCTRLNFHQSGDEHYIPPTSQLSTKHCEKFIRYCSNTGRSTANYLLTAIPTVICVVPK